MQEVSDFLVQFLKLKYIYRQHEGAYSSFSNHAEKTFVIVYVFKKIQ